VSVGLQQLESALSDPERDSLPLSWGNTNLVPKFYRCVLDLAHRYGRPVRFVRWGAELPAVPLTELYLRNIRRFLSTGRYIPLQTISEFLGRANTLLHLREDKASAGGGADGNSKRRPGRQSAKAPAQAMASSVFMAADVTPSVVSSSFSSSTSSSAPPVLGNGDGAAVPAEVGVALPVPAVEAAAVEAASSSGLVQDTPAAVVDTVAPATELAILAGYRIDEAGMLDPVPNWDAMGDRQLCRMFLSGNCVFGTKCRYAHVGCDK
jgi:hypothetical protein